MRASLLALAVSFGIAACGDNNVPEIIPPSPDPDAGVPADTQVAPPLAPCLDRPTDLPLPPTGQLSCDLLPPGFAQ